MPKRKLDFDDDQYAELEDLYLDLDKALTAHEDFDYLDRDEYAELLRDARDYLQGLLNEVEIDVSEHDRED